MPCCHIWLNLFNGVLPFCLSRVITPFDFGLGCLTLVHVGLKKIDFLDVTLVYVDGSVMCMNARTHTDSLKTPFKDV